MPPHPNRIWSVLSPGSLMPSAASFPEPCGLPSCSQEWCNPIVDENIVHEGQPVRVNPWNDDLKRSGPSEIRYFVTGDITRGNQLLVSQDRYGPMAATDQAVFLLRSKERIGLCGKFEKCFSFPACKIAVNIHRGNQKIGNGVIGRPFR